MRRRSRTSSAWRGRSAAPANTPSSRTCYPTICLPSKPPKPAVPIWTPRSKPPRRSRPEDDEDEDADADVPVETLSAADLKKLKADLAAARNETRKLEADFLNRLKLRIDDLTPDSSETLVRTILKADLMKRLDTEFATGPRALSDRYRTWATKYAVPLMVLDSRRSEAEARFSTYLKDLGYA